MNRTLTLGVPESVVTWLRETALADEPDDGDAALARALDTGRWQDHGTGRALAITADGPCLAVLLEHLSFAATGRDSTLRTSARITRDRILAAKNAPAPAAHKTAADHYRRMITTGKLAPGASLGTVRDLAEAHGLSFPDAHAMLGILRRQGLVVRLPGASTPVVVADPAQPPAQPRAYDDFVADLAAELAATAGGGGFLDWPMVRRACNDNRDLARGVLDHLLQRGTVTPVDTTSGTAYRVTEQPAE